MMKLLIALAVCGVGAFLEPHAVRPTVFLHWFHNWSGKIILQPGGAAGSSRIVDA